MNPCSSYYSYLSLKFVNSPYTNLRFDQDTPNWDLDKDDLESVLRGEALFFIFNVNIRTHTRRWRDALKKLSKTRELSKVSISFRIRGYSKYTQSSNIHILPDKQPTWVSHHQKIQTLGGGV